MMERPSLWSIRHRLLCGRRIVDDCPMRRVSVETGRFRCHPSTVWLKLTQKQVNGVLLDATPAQPLFHRASLLDRAMENAAHHAAAAEDEGRTAPDRKGDALARIIAPPLAPCVLGRSGRKP